MHPTPPPRLSTLDRGLPLWIIAAMALGLAFGHFTPGFADFLNRWKVGEVSLPIALGLFVMMYPPLAKVRYDRAALLLSDRKLMALSIALNWVLGPALMFALAWIFVPDLPGYRTGLIIIGLARCIAMVLVWNDLACGDTDAAAILVAINSLFQILMFGVLGWFYLQILPGWLGLPTTSAEFSFWAIVVSVLVFLGIPFLLAIVSRVVGEKMRGRSWYEQTFLPRVSPLALIGLLYTIVLLFALQGQRIIADPLAVGRVALPLMAYFVVMFLLALGASKASGLNYERSATVAFTAAGNNFELAIAVSIGTFGAHSAEALAGTIGPLIEVPALLGLVYLLRALAPHLFSDAPSINR